MVLKRLKWLKYLFVDRTEAETEQSYWNEKRKKHLANEHSAGIVSGLEVTETGPSSLRVAVAPGRALGADGNDPEVESAQELDLTSLVPGSGSVTAYITLAFADVEVEPYFVEETGQFQNKYVQDAFRLEASTTPPADPVVELSRVELAAGATEITDVADPANPGPNEIDLAHREYSGKEVLTLEELSDVSPDEAAAFNGMGSPSGTNPIGTLADIESSVSPVRTEVQAGRGSTPSLDSRLDMALDDDGGLKGHAATHKGDGSDAIAAATPSVAGLMSPADKGKLDTVETDAVAEGEVGDAHAAITTGNPHDLDPADVGAAPAGHVGAGGTAHALATGSVGGFMSAVDKAGLDGHIGAGGAAHAGAVAGGAAGFLSGADKSKIDTMSGAGTWIALSPAAGNLETQMAGMQPGDKFWLTPGTYTLGATLAINQPGVWLAGTKEAVIVPAQSAEISLDGVGCILFGFTFSNSTTTSDPNKSRCIYVGGDHCVVEQLWFQGHATSDGRRTAVKLNGYYCVVRKCRFFVEKTTPSSSQPLIQIYSYCTVEDNYFKTVQAGDWDTTAVLVGAGTRGIAVECRVLRNDFTIYIQPSKNMTVIAGDGPSGYFAGWIVGNRIFVNMAGNYVTGITLSGNFVVDKNRIRSCGRYGIYSDGLLDGMRITNNRVIGSGADYTETGIRLYKTTSGVVADNVTIVGNYVSYCESGILVYYGTSDAPRCVSILGNSIQEVSVEAIRLQGSSTVFLEHINVNDNVVYGFAAGIIILNVRRGTCANNQLRGGTGIGIDLGGGDGNYDVKVVACDVETTGSYCYRVGHQRNTLLNCSGRNASTAIYYVTGSHNHVVSCETHYVTCDILRVDGNRHTIANNDFAYMSGSGYAVNLTSGSSYCFVHGNRLISGDTYNGGSNNIIRDNVVSDAYVESGF